MLKWNRLRKLDTASKMLRVNHAGEFGAVNIYRAQIGLGKIFGRSDVSQLEEFLQDEKRHLAIFAKEIAARGLPRCESYWLCGVGGLGLGFLTALLGKRAIMACTWAVESVVTDHLTHQLAYLQSVGDRAAHAAVQSIIDDEVSHRETSVLEGGKNICYQPLRAVISAITKIVIRIGML